MQPGTLTKLKTLALICLFTSFAGVLYQLISELRLDYNSILVGLPLGLVFGVLELFLFSKAEKRFRQWSFTKLLVFKALLYTAVIYIVTISLATMAGLFQGRKISELPAYMVSPSEQLGHVRFYALLNELFNEISQPVLQTKAEIYQYIGDEVVLTWSVEEGLEDSNCLKTFFLFRESLTRNSGHYFKHFGVKPEFKAGLHFGKVISAQIGGLKREIVYNGDVLNTASRIQNECNKYQRDFLVSGILMDRLKNKNGFLWECIDAVILRGKEKEMELYSVNDSHQLAG